MGSNLPRVNFLPLDISLKSINRQSFQFVKNLFLKQKFADGLVWFLQIKVLNPYLNKGGPHVSNCNNRSTTSSHAINPTGSFGCCSAGNPTGGHPSRSTTGRNDCGTTKSYGNGNKFKSAIPEQHFPTSSKYCTT